MPSRTTTPAKARPKAARPKTKQPARKPPVLPDEHDTLALGEGPAVAVACEERDPVSAVRARLLGASALPAKLSVADARRAADRLDQAELSLLAAGDLDHPALRDAREEVSAIRGLLNDAADRAITQEVAGNGGGAA